MATGHKSRHVAQLSNVPLLGRSAWASCIQQVASQGTPSAKFPNLIAFLQFWSGYSHTFAIAFTKMRHIRFILAARLGIFGIAAPPDDGRVRIAVTAEWGTGTLEAAVVVEKYESLHSPLQSRMASQIRPHP